MKSRHSAGSETSLGDFHPVVREWFKRRFGRPSLPQLLGWPPIARGEHTLLLAPTGSGKTLAAFLWTINHLIEERINGEDVHGVSVLYVSPLKALNNDIHRNLRAPLDEIHQDLKAAGIKIAPLRSAVRTGDTPQSERVRMISHPPDILITTPESLYLMLTAARARKIFRTLRYLIVDEIHSLCGNKRGVHLTLSIERLHEVAEQRFVRIGLSATQRPLTTIARFLGGQEFSEGRPVPRPVTVVDAGEKKKMDLVVTSPVTDFSDLPRESVWPALLDNLLSLVRKHRSTLIFVNNRRLAERIAAQMNEFLEGEKNTFGLYAVPVSGRKRKGMADRPGMANAGVPIRAYHGSMSRNVRFAIEEELKAGTLRALVATSSLELGIDIGAIDLVVQIQSPKGIARGLQRVGRSGHLISAESKGRIIPTHREDLVEATVAGRAMLAHEVETTEIPKNCLDVLAQQIVAIVSLGEQDVDELYDLVRRSFCYEELSRELFGRVLDMLTGRYSDNAFRELRARISWDKRNNLLRPLPGSSHLAISNAGTIADRGAYGVYLEDGKTKVGEVDEEFIFESRNGDTFILGTNVWRIGSIDAHRITVTPAPGEPARMPFWRGEGIGRSYELSALVGRFRRDMAGRLGDPDCLSWLRKEFPVDGDGAWNILEYFRRQQQVAKFIPHDELIVIEGFRDEIGDPRVVVHSCFGRSINGLLGEVFARSLHNLIGIEPQMLYNDNGILLRCSDASEIPLGPLAEIPPGAIEWILEEIPATPLYGGQFRQNATRSLLMPRPVAGKRVPLWLQRLKAKDLLEITRRFDDFPVVIETLREVLTDILDLRRFRGVLRDIAKGKIRISTVETVIPSPFAASLLLDFISFYMYEWDTPRSTNTKKLPRVGAPLLSELLGHGFADGIMRPEAVAAIEDELQHTAEGFRARSPEELFEILRRLGDLNEEEVLLRSEGNGRIFLRQLALDGRAVDFQFPSGARWIAEEDTELFRQALGGTDVAPLVRRYMMTHGMVSPGEVASRYGITEDGVTATIERTFRPEEIVRVNQGSPSGQGLLSFRPILERIHRRSLAILRNEIEPVSMEDFTWFLLRWQHLDEPTRWRGKEGIEQCLAQLQGIPLPAEIWERDVIASRVDRFDPALLGSADASGTFVWTGTRGGKLMVFRRGEGAVFLTGVDSLKLGDGAQRILTYLGRNGASFLSDIRDGTKLSLRALNRGIAELFWLGTVTNDLFPEIQGVRKYQKGEDESPDPVEMLLPRRNRLRSDLMRKTRQALRETPGWTGRWSLLSSAAVMGEQLPVEERAARMTRQLLDRYGVVARELCEREGLLAWPILFTHLQSMELRGEIRRGYFVRSLSGMQFALPEAVERLKGSSLPERGPLTVINACDPAVPFGPGVEIPWKHVTDFRFHRSPGNYLVLGKGNVLAVFENFGSRMWCAEGISREVFAETIRRFLETMFQSGRKHTPGEVVAEYVNGERPGGSPFEEVFRTLGFTRDKNQTMRYSTYR